MNPVIENGYTQTTPSCPTTPDAAPMDLTVMHSLLREIWRDGYIDEPIMRQDFTSARSIFKGNPLLQIDNLLSNIRYGQKMKIGVRKDQNPLSLYSERDAEYDEVDACHQQIVSQCSVPCISSLPEFEVVEVAFDREYAYGVRACAKDTQFWDFAFYREQYDRSRGGYEFGRENDMWNTIIGAAINTPAITVDPAVAQLHPTHFWANQGNISANARDLIGAADQYMLNSFSGLNLVNILTQEAARAIIRSVENPYNLNRLDQRVNTFEQWNDIPGYELAPAVQEILGLGNIPVVVMKRSPWLSVPSCNRFPLWNDDQTKEYAVVMDPRVGYDFSVDGFHLDIRPYDCDKLIEGMIDTEYVAMGTTFPQFIVVIEFDNAAFPAQNNTPVVPATAIALSETTLEIEAGKTDTVTATLTPTTATSTVQFLSSNPAVATVTVSGKTATVTGVAAGVASITAVAGTQVASVPVTVTPAVAPQSAKAAKTAKTETE